MGSLSGLSRLGGVLDGLQRDEILQQTADCCTASLGSLALLQPGECLQTGSLGTSRSFLFAGDSSSG
jgi:hypothetical protein